MKVLLIQWHGELEECEFDALDLPVVLEAIDCGEAACVRFNNKKIEVCGETVPISRYEKLLPNGQWEKI